LRRWIWTLRSQLRSKKQVWRGDTKSIDQSFGASAVQMSSPLQRFSILQIKRTGITDSEVIAQAQGRYIFLEILRVNLAALLVFTPHRIRTSSYNVATHKNQGSTRAHRHHHRPLSFRCKNAREMCISSQGVATKQPIALVRRHEAEVLDLRAVSSPLPQRALLLLALHS
jgi:hypothetical protein